MTTPATETPETIVSTADNEAWRCICGNDTMASGFYSADRDTGAYVEPDPAWDGKTMRCGQCGRLIDQDTLAPNPNATDEWDSHLVTVVRGPAEMPDQDAFVTVPDPDNPSDSPIYEGTVHYMPKRLVPGTYTVTWVVNEGITAAHEVRTARVRVFDTGTEITPA